MSEIYAAFYDEGKGWAAPVKVNTSASSSRYPTLAIGYLQDLMAERPGAGAALVSVQRVAAEGLSTAVYAFGAWAQGYATVVILGGGAALAAALLLLRLDGARR